MDYTYVVDTSALIDFNLWYPKTAFPSLWEKFGKLTMTRIVSPEQVRNEIDESNDVVWNWCREHGRVFHKADEGMLRTVEKINNTYALDVKKRIVERADPYVIALAVRIRALNEPVIITHENRTKPKDPDAAAGVRRRKGLAGSKKIPWSQIPDIANDYEIKYGNLPWLIVQEKWSF